MYRLSIWTVFFTIFAAGVTISANSLAAVSDKRPKEQARSLTGRPSEADPDRSTLPLFVALAKVKAVVGEDDAENWIP